jgi:hypothetical protein
MGELLSLLFCFFKATLSSKCNLALENLALRQQLAILNRTQKRPAISTKDRLFWVWLSRIWSEWRAPLLIVKIGVSVKTRYGAAISPFTYRAPQTALDDLKRIESL